jgi:anti-sigma-K factor RskA
VITSVKVPQRLQTTPDTSVRNFCGTRVFSLASATATQRYENSTRERAFLSRDCGNDNNNKGASVMIVSWRSIAGTAAAGVVSAATANAQTDDIPQPENPDVLVLPATHSWTLPNLKFSADAR